MSQGDPGSERAGLPEGLRTAVERTIAATAGTAAESAEQAYSMLSAKRDPGALAERAQELLDEVARRGAEAREGIARIRLSSREEVRELNGRLAGIEERLGEIEHRLEGMANPKAES